MKEVIVNGRACEVPDGVTTVRLLLEHLGLGDRRIAVERNGGIVRRERHAETPVESGDRFEILQFVGGG